jgi:hypothetical protein
MRPERYHAQDLIRLLRARRIATMAELKAALGTQADATVFRKLESLAYRTSYSHRGRYYTLDEIARFDELGLWSFRSVWFSQFGTLRAFLLRRSNSLITSPPDGGPRPPGEPR